MLLAFSIVGNAQTKVIAHRGNSVVGPENTLCAFEMAIIAKADYIELDVHRTTDDSLVVIHDATIDRTACDNAKGEVNKMRFSELREKSFGYCGPVSYTHLTKDRIILFLPMTIGLWSDG